MSTFTSNPLGAFGGLFGGLQPTSQSTFNVTGSGPFDFSQFLPTGQPTYKHTNVLHPSMPGGGTYEFKQVGSAFAPTGQQIVGGMARDLQEQARVNEANFQRAEQGRQDYLKTSREAAQRFIDPTTSGQSMFDKAMGFQQQQEAAAKETQAAIDKQMAAAGQQLARDRAATNAAFNRAIGTVGSDTDRIASDLARASDINREAARAQGFGAIGGFEGSEGQFAALEEISRQEAEQGKFGQIAGLQQQASLQKANLMAAQAQTTANLAGLNQQFAQMQGQFAMGVGGMKVNAAEMGAQISMANAQFMQNANNNFFQATEMIGRSNMDMIRAFPMMGVNVSPTLLSMLEYSRQEQDPFPDVRLFTNRMIPDQFRQLM